MARFQSASEQEIGQILEGIDSKGTQNVVKRAVNTFRKFLAENGHCTDFEYMENSVLNDRLRVYFASIRKQGKDGEVELYKKNAFINLRYGLSKYMKKEMGIDISEHPEYATSREVYLAMCTKLKKCGMGATDHYPPISEEDLKTLYSGSHHAFNTGTPVGLQQKVWFELVFYLCRCGRENIREMSKDTFRIGKDASGKEYVFQAVDEADKNHRDRKSVV
jgi:hypothetical protein